MSLHQQLSALQQQYRLRRWRLPLWLQLETPADLPWLQQTVHEILTSQTADCGFWLGELLPDLKLPAQPQQIKHKGQLLGLEADWIVINGLQGIDWDLLAASSGCLRAGGLWLLITPSAAEFASQPNPQAQRLLSYPLQASAQASHFQQFWLSQQQDWWLWTKALGLRPQHQNQLALPTAATTTAAEPAGHIELPAAPFCSTQQQQAVAAILKVVSGHRRRPLLLTAHRGRGKSAALGIAAAQLQHQGKRSLIITAPQPAAAAVALKHAAAYLTELLPDTELVLKFWPIDGLLQDKPAADLVLVDEAAALPLPQLQQLTQHYSRLVFATTEHGYEGTGRSFSLKFQPYLQQHCPGWQQVRLQTPVRYAADDPLEQQIFRSFLLASEQPTPTYDPAAPLHTQIHQTADLMVQPLLLASIFGLLSLAHYQTEVADLWALLDNPQLQVLALYQQQQLLGCVVLSFEGELPHELATQVYQGERRVQGHLLAQSLAFHLAVPAFATLPLARIQRIVVHPACQNAGLGQSLLQAAEQHCKDRGVAVLGTSFGATPALLRFWTRQQFQPVKLSQQPEQASGEASILLLKACQPEFGAQTTLLQQQFATTLYGQLADGQRWLKPQLALMLCQPPTSTSESHSDSQLALFACGQRPYELVDGLLLAWFNRHADQPPQHIAYLLVQKLWQKHPWAELCNNRCLQLRHEPTAPQQNATKPALLKLIRQAVASTLPDDFAR
ncbi:MAG: GNAT family N-acetyltransferase [Gammaproteobacteria bacterium]|nr:GNAT family N-acetyltransferase [Gammaproteobacteria bacterium]